ncbi:hypothetical protein QZH36_18785 [Erwinia sp. BC051422]|uniref:hypothetical protein n=1 Tax=Erwinia wuhanensis TaxID=3045167 RepID=UPI00264FE9CF|nr:hypothetical protein [Erwinia sp. BC051422]MDN8543452.1 hypothetical protein [Erwinia sp. BC051422]
MLGEGITAEASQKIDNNFYFEQLNDARVPPEENKARFLYVPGRKGKFRAPARFIRCGAAFSRPTNAKNPDREVGVIAI